MTNYFLTKDFCQAQPNLQPSWGWVSIIITCLPPTPTPTPPTPTPGIVSTRQNLNSVRAQIRYVSFTNKYRLIQEDLTIVFSGGGDHRNNTPLGLTLPNFSIKIFWRTESAAKKKFRSNINQHNFNPTIFWGGGFINSPTGFTLTIFFPKNHLGKITTTYHNFNPTIFPGGGVINLPQGLTLPIFLPSSAQTPA